MLLTLKNLSSKIINLSKLEKLSFKCRNNFFWSIFCLGFCVTYPISIFSQWLDNLIFHDKTFNSQIFNLENYNPENSLSYLIWYVFYALVVTPILEEFAFRFLLSNNSYKQNVGMGCLITFFLSLINIEYAFSALLVLIPYTIFYIFWGWKNPSLISLYKVNWSTIIIFAFMFMVAHFYIPNSPIVSLLVPISVFYTFINAIILSLIRIRIGFFSSIKLHSFYNFLAFLPALFALVFQPKEINVNYINITFGFIFVFCFCFIFSKYFCSYQLFEKSED